MPFRILPYLKIWIQPVNKCSCNKRFAQWLVCSHTIMTPEEYKWTIDLTKDRYYQFRLTFEQAEKVYQFEQEKDLYSEEYYFSAWEEYDYILDNFRKILNDKQFKKFIGWHKDNIKRHEEFLIENDNKRSTLTTTMNL